MTIIHRIHQTFVGNNLNDHRPHADPEPVGLVSQPATDVRCDRDPVSGRLRFMRTDTDTDTDTAAVLEADKRARARRVYLFGIAAAVIVLFVVVVLLAYQAGEAARQAGL